jgi:hypothetical protein
MVRSAQVTNPLGYEPCKGDTLPTDFVAWGVLAGCVPVYARRGTPAPDGHRHIKAYTRETRRMRHGLCQEALASIVSQKRSLVEPALQDVNAGITEYINNRRSQDPDAVNVIARCLLPVMFSDTFWDGRLGPSKDAPSSAHTVVERALTALKGASVPQVLNIHGNLIFEIIPKLGPASPDQGVALDYWSKQLRPDALFLDRGKSPAVLQGPVTANGVGPKFQPTTRAGILGPDAPKGGWDVAERIRGVDEWQQNLDKPTPYAQSLEELGLLFTCGPSGTTAGLLVVEKMFAALKGDELKKYVLACVCCLVEGGHHNFDEVMVIAARAGCLYVPGEFLPSLPESFLATPEFKMWKAQYYDIVMKC